MNWLKRKTTKRTGYGASAEETEVEEWSPPKVIAASIFGGLLFIFAIILLFGFYNVDAGERAVEHNRWVGEFTVQDEGTHWRFPMSTKVTVYDVKVIKEESDADSATFDLQEVTTRIAVQYRPLHDNVLQIHRELGTDYADKVFHPAVQEAVKSCTAKYTYEGLIQNRSEAKFCMADIIRERMESNHLFVHNVDIVNFDPPTELSAAITQKEVAKQEALRQLNLLEAEKHRAQQKIEAAKGQAESAKIIGEQVGQHGEAYLFLQWLERWDGQLPVTMVGDDKGLLLNIDATGSEG